MNTYTIDGRTVTYVPPSRQASSGAVTWVVDTLRAPRVPDHARRVHLAPLPDHVGLKEGERRTNRRAQELARSRRVVSHHPHALAAVRTALHRRDDVMCHASDPHRRVRGYLAFREALPALRADPDSAQDPALTAAMHLADRSKRFAKLVELTGAPILGRAPSSFPSIARSIVYQQLSGRAAGTIWERFAQSLPKGRVTPKAVLSRNVTSLRAVGLSNNKAKSLLDLAAHVDSGALRPTALRRLDDQSVIETLTQVRGIGPWSAHMHLMFALGRLDVWPAADLGVRKGVEKFLKLKDTPTEKQAEPLGNRFAPYRSVAAWYMWRILDVDL